MANANEQTIHLRACDEHRAALVPLDGRLNAVARATSLALVIKRNTGVIDLDGRYHELTGQCFDDALRSVHPDDRDRTSHALQRHEAVIPLRLTLADGSSHHVEFRCATTNDELVIAVVDTSYVQATLGRTSVLETTVSDLAERNADLDAFAHAAAHDLRAPLRAMSAFSELAAAATDEGHPARFFLTRIEQSSARMTQIVESLLQLASTGRGALTMSRCDVAPIVHQACTDLSHEINQADAVIDITNLDPVVTDPAALGVILTNLIANAVKYRSDRRPKIVISSTTQDGFATIIVTDNGIGFDQSKALEIFEPFRRLHSRDQFEGSGIGLAICQRLANRLDGEIWAEASAGGGTAVSLRLPSPNTPEP